MLSSKIALFDSGVGQLSVYLEAKKVLSKESFVIFADQLNIPYGEKTQQEVIKFSSQAASYLIAKYDIKMMVLACNTATVLALSHLRRNFDIPIVGVVPAIKPAVLISRNKKITVMSTQATAKSDYLEKLVTGFAGDCQVQKMGCPGLEDAIENLNEQKIENLLSNYAAEISTFDSDVVVLGCTHYPLIKRQIKNRLKNNVKIIDSGKAIAKQMKKILETKKILSDKKEEDIFLTTADPQVFSKITTKLVKSQVKAIKVKV